MSNSSDHKGTTHGEFSVCQFFKEGAPLQESEHEYTRRFVGAEESVEAFFHYCQSVAAQMGWTNRVIITDGLDFTVMEWTYANGIAFLTEHAGKLRPEVRESSSVLASTSGNVSEDLGGRRDDPASMEPEAPAEARKGSRRDNAADEG